MRESETVSDGLSRLADEVTNYAKLVNAGFRVPDQWSPQTYVDHFTGQGPVAALIVEHVDGSGPWKTTTEYRSLMRQANTLPAEKRAQALADWVSLQAACATASPGDWQIMLRTDGALFTIDPEIVTSTPITLPDWTDT